MSLVSRAAVVWMCRVVAALVLSGVALEAGAPVSSCDVTSAGDSGAGTLRAQIESLACSEINIKVAGSITVSTPLVIQNSMVINGNGQTVTGSNTTGVFEIYSTYVVTINDMTIANGNAAYGAGVYNHGDLTLNNCTLTGNTSTSAGGAIASDTGSLTIKNSTLTANSSAIGGAIANASPSATLIHVTLVANSATSSGGGIHNASAAPLTITNSIVAGNTAPNGNELYNEGIFTSTGKNIFGISGVLGMSGAVPSPETSITPAGDLTTVVGSLTNNGGPTQTRAPVYGGPASNAGDNAAAVSANLKYDQRGSWRILDSAVDIGAVEIGTVPLNDTGIQFCGAYPSGNNDPCLGTEPSGQDAHYGTNSFDFTAINSSGNATTPTSGATPHPCVRDNVTGLMWEVKTDNTTPDLRDKDWTYTWYDSNSPDGNKGTVSGTTNCKTTGRCDTEKYVTDVNAVGLCGFNDWRMPSKKELFGIVDFGRYDPAIDTIYFPNTNSSWFCSGSPYANDSSNAWYVNFSSGLACNYNRNSSYRVRLVRGGQ